MSVDGPAAHVDRPLDAWLREHGEGLRAIRRHLHAHPELSWEEHATTEFIAERLVLAGLEPRRLASGTGLVCDLTLDRTDGPLLALRADIDALGMEDEKDVPYRSQVPGVSHACGHDVHTAVLLGAVLFLSHHPDLVPGRLRVIFQPAEERVPGGALEVIGDGALDGVDGMLGVHCDPKLDVGRIGLRAGALTSASDMAEILLSGPGGHTARPHETVDMITVAANLVVELPERVRQMLGSDDVRVVFGAMHSGDAGNVIPSACRLRAAVRTQDDGLWDRLGPTFEKAVAEILDGTGCGFQVDYTRGVPPVINDASVIDVVRRAAERELGPEAITPAVQSWGGDDYAWFSRRVPAAYVRLGVHDPTSGGPRLDLHAGKFDVDERSIAVGVRLLVASVREYFATVDPVD